MVPPNANPPIPQSEAASEKQPATLGDLVNQQLPVIDDILSERGVAIAERPWRAAFAIVEHCIVSVEGRDKASFITSDWFGAVYWPVQAWYVRRYGRRALRAKSSATIRRGVALFRGVLFQLDVPICVHRPSLEEGCFELHFPLSIGADEDTLAMLVAPPDRRSFNAQEKEQLIAQVVETGGALRRIWNLIVPIPETGGAHELKKALLDQLDGAVARALSTTDGSLGLALFDLRMCCEIALKIHLLEQRGTYQWSHHISELLGNAAAEVVKLFDTQFPTILESYKDVNSFRYGSTPGIGMSEFFKIYCSTLQFIESLLVMIKREVTLSGMVCTLRKGAWAELGPKPFGY